MSEDEIKAWFFKYGQYANGRDMALIKAIEAAIKPQRTWIGLTEQDRMEISDKLGLMDVAWLDLMEAIESKLKEKNT